MRISMGASRGREWEWDTGMGNWTRREDGDVASTRRHDDAGMPTVMLLKVFSVHFQSLFLIIIPLILSLKSGAWSLKPDGRVNRK